MAVVQRQPDLLGRLVALLVVLLPDLLCVQGGRRVLLIVLLQRLRVQGGRRPPRRGRS